MKTPKNIIIGSRGSDLALKQSEIVAQKLQALDPNITIKIKVISTKGDKNSSPIPLDVVGKGWFTKEIENELLAGTVDLAVHSLKDLPEVLPKGLAISALLEREDPRDVLISKDGQSLSQLKKGAVIGTDSLRRKVQILALRSDLVVKSIRGNVPTRLQKLENENYDAIVLAAAGLIRLDLDKQITQYFNLDEICPAPGQGALVIELKEDNSTLQELVASINDPVTQMTTTAERIFSKRVDGGCKQPVGAYASCKDNVLTLQAMVAPLDCSRLIRDSLFGPCQQGQELAEELATRILNRLN